MARKIASSATLVQTLVFYDGPQVALFKTNTMMHMLSVAVGDLDEGNLFMGIEITRKTFNQYYEGRVDLHFVFTQSLARKAYMFNWSSMDGRTVALRRPTFDEAANEEFIPARGFFEEDHTEAWKEEHFSLATQKLDIAGRWAANDLAKACNKLADVYSFLTLAEDLQDVSISKEEERVINNALTSTSWRGGGSYVGFYADISSRTSQLRPLRVSGISYHSPGYIEVEGRESVFDAIKSSVATLAKDFSAASEVYRRIDSILDRQGLKTVPKNSNFSDGALKELVEKYVDRLADHLVIKNKDRLFEACGENLLIFTKVILSYFRRLKDLVVFQNEGRLTISLPLKSAVSLEVDSSAVAGLEGRLS